MIGRDFDIENMSRIELKNEIMQLRSAIRKHMGELGRDRCHLDDNELYLVLPEGNKANTILPPECEFLAKCKQFWNNRKG